MTASVLIVVTITKFTHGAWVVFVIMPILFLLMLGGLDAGIAAPDQIKFLDVWVWNGDWTKISDCDVLTNPTGSGTTWPGSANANQAVYDPLRKRVVVQGGNGITVAANTTYVYGPNYGGSPTNFTSEFDCLTNSWVLYGTGTFSGTVTPK